MVCAATPTRRERAATLRVCPEGTPCRGRDPSIANIKVLIQDGARARFSPSGGTLVFDRANAGRWDVYLSDLQGRETPLTGGRFGERSSGNAVFDPSGKFIVFISEEPRHFMQTGLHLANPGVGLFCNLWAATAGGEHFYQLTHIPIKRTLWDKLPVRGVVNPRFSRDGSTLVWTERYDKGGGAWGKWRVQGASFLVKDGVPELSDERTLVDPSPGNYVTAMGFLGDGRLLVAGNLDGQNEYGMDQYSVDLKSGARTNLTNTRDLWEEGSCVSPRDSRIVYMSNAASPYRLDSRNRNWAAQKIERDYWIMDASGENRRRLTYFNDPKAPEYLGGRNIVAVCDISPDAKHLAVTFGFDASDGAKPDMVLKIVLIDFKQPL